MSKTKLTSKETNRLMSLKKTFIDIFTDNNKILSMGGQIVHLNDLNYTCELCMELKVT